MNTKDRVTELCRAKGISVPQLEREIGLGKSAINKWAVSMPNTEKLIRVADYFGVSLDYLVGRTSTDFSRSFNGSSVDALYAKATAEDKAVIDLILSKYKKEALAGSVG